MTRYIRVNVRPLELRFIIGPKFVQVQDKNDSGDWSNYCREKRLRCIGGPFDQQWMCQSQVATFLPFQYIAFNRANYHQRSQMEGKCSSVFIHKSLLTEPTQERSK